MKYILSLILLSLSITCILSTAETLEVKQVGANKDIAFPFIFTCTGTATQAASGTPETVTHTFKYSVDGTTYKDFDGTKMYKVEGPLTNNAVTYATLIIKPSSIAASSTLAVSCSSTWSTTVTNNGVDTPIAAGEKISVTNTGSASQITVGQAISDDQKALTLTPSTKDTKDKSQFIYNGAAISASATASYTIDTTNITDTTIYYIFSAAGATEPTQVYPIVLAKIAVTPSTLHSNCQIVTPVFKVAKQATFATAEVTLELNDGSDAVNGKSEYYQTTDTTNVIANVFIQSESLKGKQSATIKVTIVQKDSAAKTLLTSVYKYSIPAIGSESCSMTSATSTLATSSDCAKQTITNSVSGQLTPLTGVSALTTTSDGKSLELTSTNRIYTKAIVSLTINKGTNTQESRYYVYDTKPCLVVAQTAGTKACEESKFTCQRMTGDTGTVDYTWGIQPPVSGLTLTGTTDANTSINTLTIAKDKLAAATKYTLTCTSTLKTVSESNPTDVPAFTPTSCTTSPTDDDDDDNSSILGVLVIALLALVF